MRWPHWLRRLFSRRAPAAADRPAAPPRQPNPERHALRNQQAALWGRLQLEARREGRTWAEELPSLRAERHWQQRVYGEPAEGDKRHDAG